MESLARGARPHVHPSNHMGLEKQDLYSEATELFLEALRFERSASGHTVEAYANDLAQAAAFFEKQGKSGWAELDAASVFLYQSSMGPPIKTTTLRRRMSSLRSLLKFLKKEGIGPDCDLPSVSGARLPKRLPKALSLTQLQSLLDSPDLSTPQGVRDRAFMELIYGAGLRVSEACSLTFSELDLDSASLRVTGKRGKTRWLPLPALTVPWLERYATEARRALAKKPVGEVFLDGRGKPLSRSMAYRILEKHALQAGIETHVGPTSCATPTPSTCSKVAPICAPCKNCSATPASAQPRSTPNLTSKRSRKNTARHTPESSA